MSDDLGSDGSYRPLSQTVSDTKRQISQGKSSRAKDTASAVGSSLSSAGQSESDRAASDWSSIKPVAYKRGGKVRKTGHAIVHKNERVIPASKRKKAEKVMRKAGMSLTNKKRGKKRKAGRSGGRS
jgi:hypothetical protein